MATQTRGDESADEALRRLLREARDQLGTSGASASEEDAEPSEELRDIADEVDDLVSAGDATDLLSAVGVELPDESDPATIPRALTHSDPEQVAEIRTLLLLSKLSEQWGEEASGATLDDLRNLVTAPWDDEGASRSEGDRGTDSAEQTEEGTVSLEGEIRSMLADALGEFREEIQTAREELGERTDGEGEPESADGEGESETDPSRRLGESSRHTTALSTMPPAERPDMGQPTRLSTLPSKAGRRKDE